MFTPSFSSKLSLAGFAAQGTWQRSAWKSIFMNHLKQIRGTIRRQFQLGNTDAMLVSTQKWKRESCLVWGWVPDTRIWSSWMIWICKYTIHYTVDDTATGKATSSLTWAAVPIREYVALPKRCSTPAIGFIHWAGFWGSEKGKHLIDHQALVMNHFTAAARPYFTLLAWKKFAKSWMQSHEAMHLCQSMMMKSTWSGHSPRGASRAELPLPVLTYWPLIPSFILVSTARTNYA